MKTCSVFSLARQGRSSVLILLIVSVTGTAQTDINQRVSPDLFGELVDVVTPGFLHWSSASGDGVDPDADANEVDNNFGEHNGALDVATDSNPDARVRGGQRLDRQHRRGARRPHNQRGCPTAAGRPQHQHDCGRPDQMEARIPAIEEDTDEARPLDREVRTARW